MVYASSGNCNNEIGLPLAVIAAPDNADFAVYEMGAGKLGDIGYLTDIVTPDVALVNNIAPAHLERMGSLLGVARTKGEIYAALRPGGTAVINMDDAFALWFEQQCVPAGCAVLRFGLQATADVTAYSLQFSEDSVRFVLVTPQGRCRCAWRCLGVTMCVMRWQRQQWRWLLVFLCRRLRLVLVWLGRWPVAKLRMLYPVVRY